MNRIILAYNFNKDRLQSLRLVCMMLKIQLKPVARQDLLQPVGALLGIDGIERVEESFVGDDCREEMIFLCGIDRQTLDKLLFAIKRSKLQRIDLKAMLTPHNVGWSGAKLLQELAEEHQYMTKNNGAQAEHEAQN